MQTMVDEAIAFVADVLSGPIMTLYKKVIRPRVANESFCDLRKKEIERLIPIFEAPELVRVMPGIVAQIVQDLRSLLPTDEQVAASNTANIKRFNRGADASD